MLHMYTNYECADLQTEASSLGLRILKMDPTSSSKINNTFSSFKLGENQKVKMHYLAISHLDTPGQEIVEHIPP